MLIHPVIDKLSVLGLSGMLHALEEQMNMPDVDSLSFMERLGLLVDREEAVRASRRLSSRLKKSKLRHNAALEDIDFRHPRGLDKSVLLKLADCQWVKQHHNVVITGPAGVGKSYIACALAQKACREGYSALYLRVPRIFQELALARGDGRYSRLLVTLAKTDVLIFDDYGLSPLTQEQRHDLLEIFEDRHGLRSTVVASQLPLEHWHTQIGDPTLADAILDRLVHNAHQLNLKGGSMRKQKSTLT